MTGAPLKTSPFPPIQRAAPARRRPAGERARAALVAAIVLALIVVSWWPFIARALARLGW